MIHGRGPAGGDVPARERGFALAVTLAYAATLAVVLGRHEPWLDELQAWMLARDSASLGALRANARYEGHPLLWHALLFAASRVSRAPEAMQALNWALATAGAYVTARYAPFGRVQRGLLAFGYFGLFEYGVVSRSYALGALLLAAACALHARGRRWSAAAALALLAQAHAYGALVAGAFAAAAAAEYLAWDRAARRPRLLPGGRGALGLLAAVGAAGLVSAAQAVPPADAFFGAVRPTRDRPAELVDALRPLGAVARAYLPVPARSAWPGLWETSALDFFTNRLEWRGVGAGAAWLLVYGAVSAAMVAVAGAALWRRRGAFLLYALGTGAILLFGLVRFPGTLRHHGQLFLVLVAALWWAADAGPVVGASARPRVRGWRAWVAGPLFSALLVTHVAAAAVLVAADVRYPFSGARATAELLRRRGLDALPFVGAPRTTAVTVAGFLDRPVYHVEEGRVGTYAMWGRAPAADPPDSAVYAAARAYLRSGAPAVVVVTGHALPPAPGDLAVEVAGRAAGVVHRGESYEASVVRWRPGALAVRRGPAGAER